VAESALVGLQATIASRMSISSAAHNLWPRGLITTYWRDDTTVEAALVQDEAIVWHCPRCQAEGRISNWQGTLWDLSERPDTAS